MDRPQKCWIQQGRALHLQHGPIDLVIRCEGQEEACSQAFALAGSVFNDILPTLVSELSYLKKELGTELDSDSGAPTGAVASRMVQACRPFANHRVTPMAAVAGAVADYVLESMTSVSGLSRCWVNNGGDIALFLGTGEKFDCGMISDVANAAQDGIITLHAGDGVGGIATSGRATRGQGGRSFSLGIADAVTVLAKSAAQADVAATLIANQVDIPGHAGISRQQAEDLDPDSDLCDRMVVTGVADLSPEDVVLALERGCILATDACQRRMIHSAVLSLGATRRIIGYHNGSALNNPLTIEKRMLA